MELKKAFSVLLLVMALAVAAVENADTVNQSIDTDWFDAYPQVQSYVVPGS